MVDLRIRRTRAVLSDALLELAATKPVAKITVAELTRRAGINRATFYDHATSPGEFLASVLEDEFAAMTDEYLHLYEQEQTPTDALRAGLTGLVGYIEVRREVFKRAIGETPDPCVLAVFTGGLARACFEVLQQTATPTLSAQQARIVAQFAATALMGGIGAWLIHPDLSHDELIETLIDAFPKWWRTA